MIPRPGSVAAWWHGNDLDFAVVAGEEKQRVRLIGPRGREERVPAARLALEVEGPGAVPGKDIEQRRAAGERATSVAERVGRQAAAIDAALLWEVVTDGGQTVPDVVDLTDLARLALDSATGEARAGVMLALALDGIHFVRRGEDWLPRDAEAVRDLRLERERVAARAAESAALFAALAAAVAGREPYRAQGTDTERRFLHALEQLAVHEDRADEGHRELALEALRAASVRSERPHEGAFRVLRAVGRFASDDENLQLLRFGLRDAFPAAVLAAGRQAAERGFDREDRLDLTHLDCCSIDGPHTSEIDDALSIADEGETLVVGVHIADPAAFVAVGDIVDDEALARGLTYYMPDRRLPMLPPAVSEEAASLVAGVARPALSFVVRVAADGSVAGFEVVRSIIRVRTRFDYTEVDALLRAGAGAAPPSLSQLAALAERRRGARARAGAIRIRSAEVEVHVDERGLPRLDRLEAESISREIVTEAMVLAGEIAARFAASRRLPVIHRRQSGAERPVALPPEGATDPVLVRRVRMSLGRANIGLEPGPHASLGLACYAQATSPLRRFQDLATHRQIIAALAGREPPYDVLALQRILASTEQAESAARLAERATLDFWMLRYLEAQVGQTVEATVLQVEPRPIVLLLETMREQPLPSAAGAVKLGQSVRVRIERVVPRAGLLAVRLETGTQSQP